MTGLDYPREKHIIDIFVCHISHLSAGIVTNGPVYDLYNDVVKGVLFKFVDRIIAMAVLI
jgi:hypothetical protein